MDSLGQCTASGSAAALHAPDLQPLASTTDAHACGRCADCGRPPPRCVDSRSADGLRQGLRSPGERRHRWQAVPDRERSTSGVTRAHRHAAPLRHTPPETGRLPVVPQCSCFFCQQVLECIHFEHAFDQQPLEAGILFLDLLEALDLRDGHAAVGFAPAGCPSYNERIRWFLGGGEGEGAPEARLRAQDCPPPPWAAARPDRIEWH